MFQLTSFVHSFMMAASLLKPIGCCLPLLHMHANPVSRYVIAYDKFCQALYVPHSTGGQLRICGKIKGWVIVAHLCGSFSQKAMEDSYWASLWVQWITRHLFCSVSGSPSPSAPLSQRRSESSLSKGSDALGLFTFPSFFNSLLDATMDSQDSANSQSCRILDCFPKLSRRCRSRLRCREVSESGS